ncbi:hypothetical protein LCM23_13285 [Cytobacillus kochii]|uniref:hypothetical protein n=1 Tax=Cytobacillus kochii TaxID=859143 RepID=UPI001CD5268F|nr:hypothetical protein [Cytobacillus kochii]MCA1027069.1 hypothetical protein [Cytobacillus kochii]
MTATLEKTLDREVLIKLIHNKLRWSESIVRSLSEASLNEIYSYVIKGYLVTKVKTNTDGYVINMRIPKKIAVNYGIGYGDYFDIKVNLMKKEVLLLKIGRKEIKVKSNRFITLPVKLAEKKLLKGTDDTLVVAMEDRILLKSFSYMIN